MARTSVFPDSSDSPPDDSGNQDVIISAVERSMKKYADNLMRFLEGLSSRLSQLELYCHNVDKSIGEMRSDLTRDHGESDSKLKFLENHLHEVRRSIQILRDKQELADAQKELANSSQPANASPPEPHLNGLPMRTPYVPQPPPLPQPQGYAAGGAQRNASMMYGNKPGPGWVQHPSRAAHFPQGGYRRNPQQTAGGGMMPRPGLFIVLQ